MAQAHPIEFYHRQQGSVEREAIYGERWLRFAYENPLGRLALHLLVRRACFSAWYGRRMRKPESRELIADFVRDYDVPMEEALQPIEAYESFDAFFRRALKPEARPIDSDPNSLVFPADGRHLLVPELDRTTQVFAKGQTFALERLLGSAELAERYAGGALLLSRLCPVDYHRFHFPVGGQAGAARRIDGWLYSVSPLALRGRLDLLWENRREITEIESERFGRVLMLEVGATNVGCIDQTYQAQSEVERGQEKGQFGFGASLVITLYEPGRVHFSEDLLEHSAARREIYARMGERAGLTRCPK